MKPPHHPREAERLAELQRYRILDTPREEDFDEIVQLIAEICEAPVSVVNFIDADRQWFKAEIGLGVDSTPLETSLCGHVILQDEFTEIPDTHADPRMADNPLCLGDDGFRFYAGALLKTDKGLPLGTLCVLDRKPRTLTDRQKRAIQIFSHRVMRELDLRLSLQREQVLRREIDHRIKNSLASISSILSLKARRSHSEEAREVLNDVCARIRALSSLHAELHDRPDGDSVDLDSLFSRAAADLGNLLPPEVTLRLQIEAREVSANFANSLLLIANEFVSNSTKHAFAEGSGEIVLSIVVNEESWSFTAEDNGCATREDVKQAAARTGLGTQVIESIASSLGATTQWSSNDPGMRLEIAATPV